MLVVLPPLKVEVVLQAGWVSRWQIIHCRRSEVHHQVWARSQIKLTSKEAVTLRRLLGPRSLGRTTTPIHITHYTQKPSVSVGAQNVHTVSHHRLPGETNSASNAQQSPHMQNNAKEVNQNNNGHKNDKPANNKNKTNTTKTF